MLATLPSSTPNTHKELSSLAALGRWQAAAMHRLVYPPHRASHHRPCARRRGAWRPDRARGVVPGRVGAAVPHSVAWCCQPHIHLQYGWQEVGLGALSQALCRAPPPYSSGGARSHRPRKQRGFQRRSVAVDWRSRHLCVARARIVQWPAGGGGPHAPCFMAACRLTPQKPSRWSLAADLRRWARQRSAREGDKSVPVRVGRYL